MSIVQLSGSKKFDSHILMHSCIHKNDVSLAKQFKKHLSKGDRKHGVIDQVNYSKRSSKRKWTDREYHVQNNADVSNQDVRLYCNKIQFPALTFCGQHYKPHGPRS